MFREIRGNIFESKADALVNPVSCEGEMTTRLGKEYKKRFPQMFGVYKKLCKSGIMCPGEIFIYKSSRPIILNFGIKKKMNDIPDHKMIEFCLKKFAWSYWKLDVKTVAFPLIRPLTDGMGFNAAAALIREHLEKLPIDIEVYFLPTESVPEKTEH